MLKGQVISNIVSTRKQPALVGSKFLEVRLIENNQMTDKFIIAVDSVGAGIGEIVLIFLPSAASCKPFTMLAWDISRLVSLQPPFRVVKRNALNFQQSFPSVPRVEQFTFLMNLPPVCILPMLQSCLRFCNACAMRATPLLS